MKYPERLPQEKNSSEQAIRWESWALTLQREIEAAISQLVREHFPQVLTFSGEYTQGNFSLITIGYDRRLSPQDQL